MAYGFVPLITIVNNSLVREIYLDEFLILILKNDSVPVCPDLADSFKLFRVKARVVHKIPGLVELFGVGGFHEGLYVLGIVFRLDAESSEFVIRLLIFI